MSATPLPETAAKRRIGDILLDQGFVTAEELADAVLEQERTQQPLGQILVGRGAITRLELASALAEQWSDPAASITAAARKAPTLAAAPSAQDEAQYAARLQEAVADLAKKVQSNKPAEQIEERVGELSRRIESTLARTQHIEAAVATLAESLDGVTTGAEEAFYALRSGAAALVKDVARIEQAVADVAAREVSSEPAPTLADLEELRAAVAALSDAGAGTSGLRERVDELAVRLETLPDPESSITELSGRVEHLAGHVEALRSTTSVDELEATVHDLAARAGAIVDLAERLDRLESDVGASELRAELAGQALLLGDLRVVVGEIRERPVAPQDVDERLEGLQARLDASSDALPELTARIEALADRLSERPEVDPRVDGLVVTLARLEDRRDADAQVVDELRGALANHDPAAVDGRLDELTRAVDVVRAELADALASLHADDGHDERIDVLTARVEALIAESDESRTLVGKLDALQGRLSDGVVTPEELARALEALRESGPSTDDPELTARLEALEEAVANAAPAAGFEGPDSSELTRKIDALESRLADGVVTPDDLTRSIAWALREREVPAPVDDDRLADLTAEVAALRAEFESVSAPDDRAAESDRLDAIEERIETLSQVSPDEGHLAARLEELEQARRDDLDRVNGLTAAVERLRDDLTAAPSPADGGSADVLEAVAALAERIATLESAPVAAPVPARDESQLGSELERIRLVLERISLHLGEHDRALADLAPSRGVQERFQELTALVHDLAEAQQNAAPQPAAGPAPAIPADIGALLQRVEMAEAASQTDNEKLLNRLERMASSIDWRLQRLEADSASDAE